MVSAFLPASVGPSGFRVPPRALLCQAAQHGPSLPSLPSPASFVFSSQLLVGFRGLLKAYSSVYPPRLSRHGCILLGQTGVTYLGSWLQTHPSSPPSYKNPSFPPEDCVGFVLSTGTHHQLCHHSHYRMNLKLTCHYQTFFFFGITGNFIIIIIGLWFFVCFFSCFPWTSQPLGMDRTTLLNADSYQQWLPCPILVVFR